MVAAYVSARAAGRTARPWSVLWALGCVALLGVPALRDSAWPSTLAVLAAVLLAALALHGSRRWPGVLLSPLGFLSTAVSGVGWAWAGVRERGGGAGRERWLPVAKASVVAVGLLLVFGALFASADAAFADLLGELAPDVSVGEGPFRILLFLFGAVLALAAARTAAAPHRWDRIEVAPGKARSRVEWGLPLIVLNLLFAGFIAVQLAVLFGGYDKVLESTGLTYSEYARQGFWQLLWATVFVLGVIALALRWAPRGTWRPALRAGGAGCAVPADAGGGRLRRAADGPVRGRVRADPAAAVGGHDGAVARAGDRVADGGRGGGRSLAGPGGGRERGGDGAGVRAGVPGRGDRAEQRDAVPGGGQDRPGLRP